MADSTKLIQGLKRAANYSKLTMRQFGPKSYKQGQGALLKVLVKFGDDGSMCKKGLEKKLNWRGKDLRHVAKKAERNGYVTIQDAEFKFIVSITDKGREVMQKRFAAEDKAADMILEGLNTEERQQLANLCEKISKNCEGLGIDYSEIKKRSGKGAGHGKKGCPQGHGEGNGQDGKCCRQEGHGHGGKYVFVFKG
ncbi:MAG: winged helix-turn-helix transcriptional regulator [Eggerthellaceae bacterium]|nr:winged helix-turn-helix transcriptional regulator [Eggerthellaceae bacterium]